MRNLELKLAEFERRPAEKLVKFNIEEQREFFKREMVRKIYLKELPLMVEEKRKVNALKIKQLEEDLKNILAH
jgi:hypothetical protein